MPDTVHLRRASLSWVLVIAACVIGASVIPWLLWQRDPIVVDENHLIEWSQAALLLLAALVHGLRITPDRGRAGRTVRAGMSLLCLSLAAREVDIDELWRPELMEHVETGLRASLVVAWLALIWWRRRAIKPIWRARRSLVFSRFALLTGLGCLCYIASRPFDKNQLDLEGGLHMLIEETLQLNATLLFLLGAMAPLPRALDSSLSESTNLHHVV